MKILAFVLVVLLTACSISLSAAMSDTDKSIIKLTAFSVLDKTGDFNYVSADIDWNNNLNIWYVPKKADQDSSLMDLAYIIGVYWGACQSHSDLSDLNIMLGTKDNVVGKLYCERVWIDAVKTDYEGNMDKTDAGLLVLKVLGTFEKTS